jgi:hypothetical protein
MTRSAYTLVVGLVLGTTFPNGRSLAAQGAQPLNDPVLIAIAAAAELPALDGTDLPANYREIRIRSEQDIVCCQPRPMLRLVERNGDIDGSLWLFRMFVLRTGNPRPSR